MGNSIPLTVLHTRRFGFVNISSRRGSFLGGRVSELSLRVKGRWAPSAQPDRRSARCAHARGHLEEDWRAGATQPAFACPLRSWREAEPALSRIRRPQRSCASCAAAGRAREKDAVLCALLRWARQEPIGARVVLETIRPGLLDLSARIIATRGARGVFGGDVRARSGRGFVRYPVRAGRARVAANLLLDTLNLTFDELGRESRADCRARQLDPEQRPTPEELGRG